MSRFAKIVMALLIVTLAAAGCGGGGAAEAQKAVCGAVTGLETTVASLTAVTAETTGKDIKALAKNLEAPLAALRTANSVIKNEALTGLLSSYDSVSKSIAALPDDQTVGDAAVQLQPAVQQVQHALTTVSTSLKCAQ